MNKFHKLKQQRSFEGDPAPENGFIDLDDNKPGLGLIITDKYKSEFNIIE